MIFSRIIDIIDERIDLSIFDQSITIEHSDGLEDIEGRTYRAKVWWSFLTGLNVDIKENLTLFSVSPVFSPEDINNLFIRNLKVYVTEKTKELYREFLLKHSSKDIISHRSVLFGEDVELFSIKDGVIHQNKFIPVELDKTIEVLKIPRSRFETKKHTLETRDYQETSEDFEKRCTLSLNLRGADTDEDIEDIFMKSYTCIFEILRNDNKKMCLPGVWFIKNHGDVGIFLEFTTKGYEVSMISHGKLVTHITSDTLYKTFESPDMFMYGIMSELQFYTLRFYETQFELCVGDIVKEFKGGNVLLIEGEAGASRWNVLYTDDAESESGSESAGSYISEPELESEDETGDDPGPNISEADTESENDSDSDGDDISEVGEYDEEEFLANAFREIYEERADIVSMEKSPRVIAMRLVGEEEPFWRSDTLATLMFRTRGYVALAAVIKQLETVEIQTTYAIASMMTMETRKKKLVGLLNIKIRDNKAYICINGRIITVDLSTGEKTGLLEDTVFDRVLSRWSPSDECVVCQSNGGFKTACCKQTIHATCIQKWTEACGKNGVDTTCPMCRSEYYIL